MLADPTQGGCSCIGSHSREELYDPNGTSRRGLSFGYVTLLPAQAQNNLRALSNLVSCGITAACVVGSNTSVGPGVEGNSARVAGAVGRTTFNSTSSSNGQAGVIGQDLSASGKSNFGVKGTSKSGVGVIGTSSGGDGVDAISSSGYGLRATSSSTTNPAVGGSNSKSGAGVFGISVNRAPAGTGFPIVATDSVGNNLFWVDGSGNIFYHGGIHNFARTTAGAMATEFVPNATAPTVEDNGSAQLVNGQAAVKLDPAFAATIDMQHPYRVFLTLMRYTRSVRRGKDGRRFHRA